MSKKKNSSAQLKHNIGPRTNQSNFKIVYKPQNKQQNPKQTKNPFTMEEISGFQLSRGTAAFIQTTVAKVSRSPSTPGHHPPHSLPRLPLLTPTDTPENNSTQAH